MKKLFGLGKPGSRLGSVRRVDDGRLAGYRRYQQRGQAQNRQEREPGRGRPTFSSAHGITSLRQRVTRLRLDAGPARIANQHPRSSMNFLASL